HYQDCMDHHHIHGANLSFSAAVYMQVGGFEPVPCHEDVSLINKLIRQCCNITWSNLVRVTTSSRLEGRAPEGLSKFLENL
ncbi:glycosyltransferase family 2 protein, partial [Acinetobacter baumannii]